MTIVSVLLWIAEHWWIIAIAAALILVAALWGGVVSTSLVVKALADIAAAIADFFAHPTEQIAAKILYGIAAIALGLSIGRWHGITTERAIWKQREAAHVAAMEKLKADAAAEATEKVNQATAAERANTEAAEKRASDYAEKLKTAPIGACGLDDSDLAAGGVSAHGNRPGGRRHSD